ncbi:hypothetical protein AB0C21_28420 [Spirillospora sp. NPDC049024]
MKKRWVWPVVVGGVLLAVGVAAAANPSRWIWLGDRSLWWALLLTAGLGTLGVTCIQLAAAVGGLPRRGAVLAACVLCPAALLFMAASILSWAWADEDKDVRIVATSGDGRFELVLHETSNIIDPVQGWYVQSRNGPFSRRAYLGCFNPDSGGDWIESARFTGPGTVELKGNEQRVLRFDPENVRSIDTVEEGLCARRLYTE